MDLRFVARDGEDLILESDQGQRFQVQIDDSIREAIKNNPRVSAADFSPRQVQDMIRAGSSVDEVAAHLGLDVVAIDPFAAPILDELRYVLEAALNTEVSDGAQMRRFEDLITAGEPAAVFSVAKSDGRWQITAQGESLMTWTFDPRTRAIEPTNPEASRLGKQESRRDVTAPVAPTQANRTAGPEIISEQVLESDTGGERTASVHSLVEELRTRRKQEELKPATAKGRASLPSWDEIVLGTTNSETDAD